MHVIREREQGCHIKRQRSEHDATVTLACAGPPLPQGKRNMLDMHELSDQQPTKHDASAPWSENRTSTMPASRSNAKGLIFFFCLPFAISKAGPFEGKQTHQHKHKTLAVHKNVFESVCAAARQHGKACKLGVKAAKFGAATTLHAPLRHKRRTVNYGAVPPPGGKFFFLKSTPPRGN